jgi:hypothetical protein
MVSVSVRVRVIEGEVGRYAISSTNLLGGILTDSTRDRIKELSREILLTAWQDCSPM